MLRFSRTKIKNDGFGVLQDRTFERYKMNEVMTRKQAKLAAMLTRHGHTNVRVWWETITAAMEMCGQGGGWMAETDQVGVEPLGLNYDRAVDHIQTAAWMTLNAKVTGSPALSASPCGLQG
jgi:hypothetical protein